MHDTIADRAQGARCQYPYDPARYEQLPAFNQRWRPVFAPNASERLTAYTTAARLAYLDLLGDIAALRKDERSGEVDALSAARERIALMTGHLSEVDRLREVYEVAA